MGKEKNMWMIRLTMKYFNQNLHYIVIYFQKRLTRGKKRKLLDNDSREASDFEVNSDKVVKLDDEESCEEASQDWQWLKILSDEDCPIDKEDKVAVDPLLLLIKPCCVRLQKLDRRDCKETLEVATSIDVKEVDLTREIILYNLNSQDDNRSESLDEIADPGVGDGSNRLEKS